MKKTIIILFLLPAFCKAQEFEFHDSDSLKNYHYYPLIISGWINGQFDRVLYLEGKDSILVVVDSLAAIKSFIQILKQNLEYEAKLRGAIKVLGEMFIEPDDEPLPIYIPDKIIL